MVCTICGKHSHFHIGQAHSIHCAVMQLMTAVEHRHVRPTPNNTHPVNPPIKHNFGYPVGPVTKKVVLLPTERTIGGQCISAFSFQVTLHSPTLQFCAELRFDHQTVTDRSQFCCKAMPNFILICSLSLILMVVGGGGGGIVIVAGCA